jgi:ribosome-associated heat shock protein Hsp15
LAGPGARPDPNTQPKLRLDKWLWQARFFKTRALAAKVVEGGRCRVNGQRTAKPGHGVQAGDVLIFTQARLVRVVRVAALGQRRGPADEAQALYDDMTPDATDSPLE